MELDPLLVARMYGVLSSDDLTQGSTNAWAIQSMLLDKNSNNEDSGLQRNKLLYRTGFLTTRKSMAWTTNLQAEGKGGIIHPGPLFAGLEVESSLSTRSYGHQAWHANLVFCFKTMTPT